MIHEISDALSTLSVYDFSVSGNLRIKKPASGVGKNGLKTLTE